MAATDTLNMAAPAMVRICLYEGIYNDLKAHQPQHKAAAEGIHALAVTPGFRRQ
ncbi:hypothetical protein KCP73_02170 [Salmonella enterica subsp. enterica]|nr:hypothetical protein KCP73_02170 [Salmonella enterica subsp. enterica]